MSPAIKLVCPACGSPVSAPMLGSVKRGDVRCTCGACYAHHWGVVDLRSEPHVSCWAGARVNVEAELVGRLVDAFPRATLAELVTIYSAAYRLPGPLAARDRDYMLRADSRERWTVQYMGFSVKRYGENWFSGGLALDAGCGSGGAIPHLADRFASVAGLDPDLPLLLVAAKRCLDHHLADRVTLVAAPLERPVFPAASFDAVKCTDVIEHVEDPERACRTMACVTRRGGSIFILTPNRWSVWTAEPHVALWGVNLMPVAMADRYVERRIGVRYSRITRLLSYRRLAHTLRATAPSRVVFVPIEDKFPDSARGTRAKAMLSQVPFRWISRMARPIQPSLEVCVSPLESAGGVAYTAP